jgi:hypothetical protein
LVKKISAQAQANQNYLLGGLDMRLELDHPEGKWNEMWEGVGPVLNIKGQVISCLEIGHW